MGQLIIPLKPILNSLSAYQRGKGRQQRRPFFARRMPSQEKFLFEPPKKFVFLESSIG